MKHWSDKYLGLPYVEGSFDCADLARLVQKEVFGRDVAIPGSRDYFGKRGSEKLQAMQGQIASELEKGDVAVPVAEPQEGDAVLIFARGYLEHIGVYCTLNGEPYVLHASPGRAAKQVIRSRLRGFTNFGYTVEGYYKWI